MEIYIQGNRKTVPAGGGLQKPWTAGLRPWREKYRKNLTAQR